MYERLVDILLDNLTTILEGIEILGTQIIESIQKFRDTIKKLGPDDNFQK